MSMAIVDMTDERKEKVRDVRVNMEVTRVRYSARECKVIKTLQTRAFLLVPTNVSIVCVIEVNQCNYGNRNRRIIQNTNR